MRHFSLSPYRASRVAIAFASVSALLVLPACQSKKLLDHTVEALRVAAETDNYAAFKDLARPELVAKLPKATLTRLSKALNDPTRSSRLAIPSRSGCAFTA